MTVRVLLFIASAVLLLLPACGPESQGSGPEQETSSGELLARRHCRQCHMLPEPDLLTREVWRDWVLPQMGHRLGIYEGKRPDSLFERGIGGQIVVTANVFPEQPVLPREQWESIVDYYLKAAPADSLPTAREQEPKVGLSSFRLSVPEFRLNPPLTSLLQFNPESQRIVIGDVAEEGAVLHILDQGMERRESVGLSSAPSSLHDDGDVMLVTLMGNMPPTDEPSGHIVRVDPRDRSTEVLIDSLQRPTHTAFADLNGDGRKDAVVSEFGFRTGALSWFELLESGEYLRHTLRSDPGATRSVVQDVNGDGRPDIATLTAQGEEAVYIYYNEGGGRFREDRVLRFPPSFGSTYFDLIDFDADGHLDILYVNGDNADYPPIMKSYHGIRIYRNDGRNQFKETFFHHMDGAYKAVVRDFDLDGDPDIAAISFFPDYRSSLLGSFVYLRNDGHENFSAETFQECSIGRWLVFDGGDVDADGDDDLLLGSFVGVAMNAEYVPSRLRAWWINQGPSLLLLENTTIDD